MTPAIPKPSSQQPAPRPKGEGIALDHIVFIGLLVLAVLPFTCRRRSEEHQRTLRFWCRGTPDELALFGEAVRRFEAKHPGVRVKIEAPGQGLNKVLTALQAGNCGDVLYLHWTTIPTLASKNGLMRLDQAAERDGYGLDDFFPAGIEAYSYRDGLYALPFQGSTMAMFYNKDLFDQAGLAYPNAEWTWEEFLAAAKRLTRIDASGRMTQVGCLPYDPSSWVWSAGGKFIDDACETMYFTDPATIAGLTFYANLRNRWQVTTRHMNLVGADPMAVDVFERGHVAMDISGPWNLPKYVRASEEHGLDWDIALMPKGPAGRQTRYAGMGIGVWAQSPHRELAWEFAKFLADAETMRVFSRGWADIPARRSAAYDTFARQEAPFDMKVLLQSLEPEFARVRVYPKTEQWANIFQFFRQEYETTLLGKQTVAEAMALTEQKVARYLAEEAAMAGPGDYVALALLGVLSAAGAVVYGRRMRRRAR
jgi:multiple sugar transport system substrate-binding protein